MKTKIDFKSANLIVRSRHRPCLAPSRNVSKVVAGKLNGPTVINSNRIRVDRTGVYVDACENTPPFCERIIIVGDEDSVLTIPLMRQNDGYIVYGEFRTILIAV